MTDSDDILATGTATQTQLSKLFRRNKSDMPRLLGGSTPVGTRKGYDVYSIVEVAPALLKPSDPAEVEAALRRMNKADMPPQVGNDFWSGQRSRIKYEQENGDLWATADVEALVTAIFHVVAMQMKLAEDTVDRTSGLTEANRASVRRISEGVVNGVREAIVDRMADWQAPEDNVMGNELGDPI